MRDCRVHQLPSELRRRGRTYLAMSSCSMRSCPRRPEETRARSESTSNHRSSSSSSTALPSTSSRFPPDWTCSTASTCRFVRLNSASVPAFGSVSVSHWARTRRDVPSRARTQGISVSVIASALAAASSPPSLAGAAPSSVTIARSGSSSAGACACQCNSCEREELTTARRFLAMSCCTR